MFKHFLLGCGLVLVPLIVTIVSRAIGKRLARPRGIRKIKPTTGDQEDLLGHVYGIQSMIRRANSIKSLDRAEQLTNMLHPAFCSLDRTAYWMNSLHTKILIRRCEILALQCPIIEE